MRKWIVLGCLLALMTPLAIRLPAAQATVTTKKHCKLVTKKVHGHKKKVKVCTSVKPKATATPKPTQTPIPTATATTVPVTISVSMAAPVPGVTVTQSNGVYEFTDTTFGDRLDISQVLISKTTYDPLSYTVALSVKEEKIPSEMDGTFPDLAVVSSWITLVAANQHPFIFGGLQCTTPPQLPNEDLYDGDTAQGWACTDIPRQNAAGNYILTWQPAYSHLQPTNTILNVRITVPPS